MIETSPLNWPHTLSSILNLKVVQNLPFKLSQPLINIVVIVPTFVTKNCNHILKDHWQLHFY
eukprot:15350539-Ditylum_brightwellii.AAC.1